MRKIYIASRWLSQKRLREVCRRLHDVVEVTSSWIYAERPEEPTAEFFKAHGAPRATADVIDIQAADWLVLDLLDGRGRRGGMMFEAGLAYGIGKRVVVIGDADCVFTQLFEAFPTWDAFIDKMKETYHAHR